jgi:hypothetical protein
MKRHRRSPRLRRPSVPIASAHAPSAALQRRSASGPRFSTTARAVGPASSIETRFKPGDHDHGPRYRYGRLRRTETQRRRVLTSPRARLPRRSAGGRAGASCLPCRSASATRTSPEPARRLHPEGAGRRSEDLPPNRRLYRWSPRRDFHRHAQGGRDFPVADEQFRDRRVARPTARRMAPCNS